jgi:hypothetical protein
LVRQRKTGAAKFCGPGKLGAAVLRPYMSCRRMHTELNCKNLGAIGKSELTGKRRVGRVGEEKAKLLSGSII